MINNQLARVLAVVQKPSSNTQNLNMVIIIVIVIVILIVVGAVFSNKK